MGQLNSASKQNQGWGSFSRVATEYIPAHSFQLSQLVSTRLSTSARTTQGLIEAGYVFSAVENGIDI